jgi:hypothetical protein
MNIKHILRDKIRVIKKNDLSGVLVGDTEPKPEPEPEKVRKHKVENFFFGDDGIKGWKRNRENREISALARLASPSGEFRFGGL